MGKDHARRAEVASVSLACRLGILLCALWLCSYGPRAAAQTPDGLAGAPTTNLSQSPGIVSRYADIAADCAGNVHVVWVEEDGGEDAVHSLNYAMWDGRQWTEPNSIAVAWQVILPSIGADPLGNLHLVYNTGDTLLYTRTAGAPPWLARSWSKPLAIGERGEADYLHWFEMLVDGEGRLHLLVERFGNFARPDYFSQVEYSRSADGGATWSAPVQLSGAGAIATVGTSSFLAVDEQGVVYALWDESPVNPYAQVDAGGSSNENAVMFARSPDGGASWEDPVALSDPREPWNAALAVVSDGRGTLHALWLQGRSDLVHRRSTDRGQSWAEPQVAFHGQGDFTRYGKAGAAVDSRGGLHVVLPLDTRDLYYLAWDGGQWQAPVNVSSDSARTSYWPRLAVAGGNQLHLVWNQGYPELALYDLAQRLERGEYEILHKELVLAAPAASVQPCRIDAASAPAATGLEQSGPSPTSEPASSPTAPPTRTLMEPYTASESFSNQAATPVLWGVIPALLVVAAAVLGRLLRSR